MQTIFFRIFTFIKHQSCCLFVLSGILLMPSLQSINAQDCDDCSYPKVALYDLAVKVPRPVQSDSILKWWNLFFAGPYAKGYIQEQYPPGSCITFLNGAMINAKEYQNDTLRFGSEYTNVPPAGPLLSSDYLITGEINALNGQYSVRISLEAAYSREVVATGYATFSNSDVTGASNAGVAAAKQISPLLKIIKDFERNKRDTDTKVAIKDLWKKDTPPDIILIPAQKNIDVNQKTDVEIKLSDCDGVPLKNREILLTGGEFEGLKLDASVGGRFVTAKAVTDDNGIARVQFAAGDKECLGVLYAYFKHEKPNGRKACFMGTAYVNIKQVPVRYYILNAALSETKSYQRDTSWSDSFGGVSWRGEYRENENIEYKANITAVLENQSDAAGVFYFNTGNPPLTVNGSGTMSESAYSKSIERMNGYIWSGDIRSTSISGYPLIDQVRIEAVFENEEDFVNITVPFRRKGVYMGHLHGTTEVGEVPGWQPYDGEYNDSSGAVSAGLLAKKGVHVQRSDNGYRINYTESESTSENTIHGTATIKSLLSLNATLVPYDKLTDVEKAESADRVPERYSLTQNFPNPFNPATTINYTLSSGSAVKLKVYDMLGKEVITLVDEYMPAGTHSVQFKAGNLPSGLYIYTIEAGEYRESRKLLLLK